jgi:hypothetical protein
MRIAIFHNRYPRARRRGHRGRRRGRAAREGRPHRGALHRRQPRRAREPGRRAAHRAARAPGNRRAPRSPARLAEQAPLDVAPRPQLLSRCSRPAVHETLSARGVPVVQTLHNYRFACANGNLLRAGRVCEECIPRGRGTRCATAATAARARRRWCGPTRSRTTGARHLAPLRRPLRRSDRVRARVLIEAGLPRERSTCCRSCSPTGRARAAGHGRCTSAGSRPRRASTC